MKRIRLIYALLLLLSTINGRAQDFKRTWNWYFGKNAGLNFSSGTPTVLTDGLLNTWEGCATISDSNGQLQFYTDGRTVWNKNHQVMQNGTGLKAYPSSTQAALIVPVPENDSLFYIFTTDAVADKDGLQYSLVNIKAANGLGSVVKKNILLQTPTCERLAATYHANGTDIWVMTHDFGSNAFRAFLITKQGLIDCPVISNASSIIDGNVTRAQGHMKFSKNGEKILQVVYNWFVEILDFDRNTGKVSPNNVLVLKNISSPYGIELSPSMRYVYVSDRGKNLYQFDLSSGQEDSINASRFTISTQATIDFFSAVQLGANGKIYVAIYDSSFIGVIHNPDSAGIKCNLQINGFYLNGSKSQAGLPNFISSYFNRPSLDFSYAFSCGSRQISLKGKSESPPAYWHWAIQKVPGGTAVQLNGQQSNYIFPDSGWYRIELKTDTDSLQKLVYVEEKLLPLQEQNVCGQDSVLLSAAAAYRCPVWNDSISTFNLWVKSNGTYRVQAYTAQGCLHSDSLRVRFVPLPSKPVITQKGDSLLASLAKTYQWYFNGSPVPAATASVWKAQQNGFYQVLISDSNDCQALSDSFEMSNVGINPSPQTAALPHIYPNPSQGVFTLFAPQATPPVQLIEILDLAGKSMWQQPVTQSKQELDCSFLEPGLYLIKLYTHTAKAYYQKILIQ